MPKVDDRDLATVELAGLAEGGSFCYLNVFDLFAVAGPGVAAYDGDASAELGSFRL